MSDSCVCPLAGYCDRHSVKKTSNLHKLCQQGGAYWEAWESGNGPGQIVALVETYERKAQLAARKAKIIEQVERNNRLRGWVVSMRISGEAGIGDTLVRLIELAGRREVKKELQCMQQQCSCGKIDATEKLNKDYPY